MIANNKLKTADGSEHDFKSMNSAKTFALVMLIINGLYLLWSIYSIATTDWDVFMEQYRKALEQQ